MSDITYYKKATAAKDDKLNIDNIERYNLSLQMGERDLQVAIIDTKNNRCLLMEDYIFTEKENPVKAVQQVFDQHHLLKAGFWKEVCLSFKTPKHTFVPLSYFSKDIARDLLKSNCEIDPDQEGVGYYRVKAMDAVNIFTFNREVLQYVRSVYPKKTVRVSHQSGMLISALLEEKGKSSAPLFAVYIDRFFMHIAVLKDKQLQLYNTFPIKKFEDYTRFIGLTIREMGLRSNEADIRLWGFIKANSKHFQELNKHFTHLRLGNRPKFLQFGYQFDEIPEHHFMDVYGIYLNN